MVLLRSPVRGHPRPTIFVHSRKICQKNKSLQRWLHSPLFHFEAFTRIEAFAVSPNCVHPGCGGTAVPHRGPGDFQHGAGEEIAAAGTRTLKCAWGFSFESPPRDRALPFL